MNLKVFLASQDMTIKEFGSLVGVSSRYLSRVIHGHSTAGPKLRKVIADLSGGQVDVNLTLSSRKRIPKNPS